MPNADEIFNYVMNSPENTNPAVLRSMLNSIEEGGGGGVLVVTLGVNALDKTWQEIHDAMLIGGAVISSPIISGVNIITAASYNPKAEQYVVESANVLYVTSTADGYPAKNAPA